MGHFDLTIPYGSNGYTTAADWYFPTQADGSVLADGVIWLQHDLRPRRGQLGHAGHSIHRLYGNPGQPIILGPAAAVVV